MSHNSKYYNKKLRKRDSEGTQKLQSFLIPKSTTTSHLNDQDQNELSSSSSVNEPPVSTFLESGISDEKNDSCDIGACSSHSNSEHVAIDKMTPPQEVQKELSLPEVKDMKAGKELESNFSSSNFKASNKFLSAHPWLQYDFQMQGYMCNVCRVFGVPADVGESDVTFVTKPAVWKSSGGHPGRKLKIHADSTRHQNALKRQVDYINSSRRGTVIQQIKKAAERSGEERRTRNRDYIKKLAKLLYKMVTKHWAVSDNFEDMVRFMAVDMELPVFRDYLNSCREDHETYLSAGSVSQLLTCISDSIETETLRALNRQPCIAIMADETTDRSNTEQFAVYARFPTEKSMEHYLGIIHVEQTTAKALTEALTGFLLGKGIDIKRVVFTAFDGCNTMSGVNKGVQRQFRHQAVYAIYINCRNHKLALCFKHLFKQYPLLEETDSCLVTLANMFQYSPQKQAVLEKVQEVKGEKVLLPIKPSVTRWLSHRNCCVRLTERYESIIDSLDSIYSDKGKDPQVFGLRAALLKPEIVCMVMCLCEVLSETNKLSLILQREDTNFLKLPVYVNSTVSSIQEIGRRLESKHFEELEYFNKCEDLLDVIKERTNLARRLRDDEFDKDIVIRNILLPFIKSLEGEIVDTFYCHPVLQSFGVLDPRNLPENLLDMQDYGEHEISVLADHYGKAIEDVFEGHTTVGTPFVDRERLKVEFRSFKHQMYALRHTNKDGMSSIRSLLGHFEEPGLKQIYPNVYMILQIVNVLPTGTASVERAFSHLGGIKTKLRTSMSQKTLDQIMRCSLHDMTILPEKQYDDVVDRFRDFGPDRRIDL